MFQAIILYNFQENVQTKLEKITKKLIFGLILAHLAQIWITKFFFWGDGGEGGGGGGSTSG